MRWEKLSFSIANHLKPSDNTGKTLVIIIDYVIPLKRIWRAEALCGRICLLILLQFKIEKKLQRVQNSLARAVFRVSLETPSKPPLKVLHWLPVQQRPTYKISLLVFKFLQSKRPSYLHSLLAPRDPVRCLR